MGLKVLITGAGGQLGKEFLKERYRRNDLIIKGLDREALDVSDVLSVSLVLDDEKPDILINCSGYTAVDDAEDNPDEARLINTTAPAQLAFECKRRNIKLIHFSTDYVFDGSSSRPYKEKDNTNPLNVYGQTKREGEELVLRYHPDALVIRVSWLYSAQGKNFLHTMLRLGAEKEHIQVVNDQVSCPTFAGFLVDDILSLLKGGAEKLKELTGIFHYSLEGEVSWFDFAKLIMKNAGLQCEIDPVSSVIFEAKAKRPSYSKLDSSRWKNSTGQQSKKWESGLEDCLKELKIDHARDQN